MELGRPPHPGGESLSIAAAAHHLKVLFGKLTSADRQEYRDKLRRENLTRRGGGGGGGGLKQADNDASGRVSYQILKKKEAEIEAILEKMSQSASSTKSLSAWLCILKAELEKHEMLRSRLYKMSDSRSSSFSKTLLELEGSLIAGLVYTQKAKQTKKAVVAVATSSAGEGSSNLRDELARRNSSSRLSYDELVAHFDKSKPRKQRGGPSAGEDGECKRDDDSVIAPDKEDEDNLHTEMDVADISSTSQSVDSVKVLEAEDEGHLQTEMDIADISSGSQSVDSLKLLEKEDEGHLQTEMDVADISSGSQSDDSVIALDKEDEANLQTEMDLADVSSGGDRDDHPPYALNVRDQDEQGKQQTESDAEDGSSGSERDYQSADSSNGQDKDAEGDVRLENDAADESRASGIAENTQVEAVDSVTDSEVIDTQVSHIPDVASQEFVNGETNAQACPLPELIRSPNEDTPLSLVEDFSLTVRPEDSCFVSSPRSSCVDETSLRCLSAEDMFDGKSTSSLSTTLTVAGCGGYISAPVFSGSYYEYEQQVVLYEEEMARRRQRKMELEKKKALANVYRLQLQALESACSKEYRTLQQMKLELEPLRRITDTWNILQDDSLDFLCIPTPPPRVCPALENCPEDSCSFLVTSQVRLSPDQQAATFQLSTLT